jgi:hypothetical protein
MAKIPFGTTISYTAFATATSQPKAAHAAGTVCDTNPIPVIPVIGYCAQIGSLEIIMVAAICHQHIRIIYNIKRFSSAMEHSSLIGGRQKMPDLAVHLVKEIIIAL